MMTWKLQMHQDNMIYYISKSFEVMCLCEKETEM